MTFIKKLLTGKTDESVHQQFVRYGKGTFTNRAMALIKKQKDGVKITTSFEYSIDLAWLIARDATSTITLSGTIITHHDITKELSFPATYTKRMGVGKIEIPETTITKETLRDLLTKTDKNLTLLNLHADNCTLECKQTIPNAKKAPKVDAEGKEEAPKINHCKATFANPTIADEFIFETTNYTTAKVTHAFLIEGFDVPKQYAHDPEQARINAKRTGRIIRTLDVDGNITQNEYPFAA